MAAASAEAAPPESQAARLRSSVALEAILWPHATTTQADQHALQRQRPGLSMSRPPNSPALCKDNSSSDSTADALPSKLVHATCRKSTAFANSRISQRVPLQLQVMHAAACHCEPE